MAKPAPIVVLALILLATCSSAGATVHKRCYFQKHHCLHRCEVAHERGRLSDEALHKCNRKCVEANVACERTCLFSWSCGGDIRD
jgi:hypothetical protein